jgi:hypothetical protein
MTQDSGSSKSVGGNVCYGDYHAYPQIYAGSPEYAEQYFNRCICGKKRKVTTVKEIDAQQVQLEMQKSGESTALRELGQSAQSPAPSELRVAIRHKVNDAFQYGEETGDFTQSMTVVNAALDLIVNGILELVAAETTKARIDELKMLDSLARQDEFDYHDAGDWFSAIKARLTELEKSL